jgi:hypothetical protein
MRDGTERLAVVLRAYPRSYRARRGEEILATLEEGAPDRDGAETLRVCVDLVAHGLRLRLGIASDQATGRVLAAAALPGLMMALAAALVLPFVAQVLPGIRHSTVDWGPDTAIWPGLLAVWIVGSLAALVLPKYKRLLAGTCVAATLVAVTALPAYSWGSPPVFWLLVALAVPSLLAPRTSPRRSHRWFALLVGGLVLGALVVASLQSPWFGTGGPGFYYEAVGFAPAVAGAVLVCALILLAARRWVLGSALALLGIPWLVFAAVGHGPVRVSATTSVVSVSLACIVGVGLLALWVSGVRVRHEGAGEDSQPAGGD